MSASTNNLESKLAELINRGAFTGRRWSWIAEDGPFFLKIPRIRDSVSEDAASAEAREHALGEYEALMLLSGICSSITEPIAYLEKHACIVLPLIPGRDLRGTLLANPDSDRSRNLLKESINLIGNLHFRTAGQVANAYPSKSYPKTLRSAVRRQATSSARTLVVRGIEVRNIRIETKTGMLWLFDPEKVESGYPEDDVTRFILSLLMLRWGRHLDARIWTSFSFSDLIATYEVASKISIDRDSLRYCFALNVRMRMEDARAEIARMSIALRPLATSYMYALFAQVRLWAKHHDL